MKKILHFILPVIAWLCGIIITGSFLVVTGYLLIKGFSAINLKLIFGSAKPIDALLLKEVVFDGLFPAVFGTVVLVISSVTIAIPLGVLTGIYLAEYAGIKTKNIFNILYDILAGLPSIVIGLFGFSIAVFLHKYFSSNIYPCLLISSVSLAILVLPYIIRTTQISIISLPVSVRNSGLALGATKLQNIFFVLLPQSVSGIFSGVILAVGRCAEDTAVIMLTGVAAMAGIPKSILSNYEALPFYIYHISANFKDAQELSYGFGAAIILLLISMSFFFVASFVKSKLEYLTLH